MDYSLHIGFIHSGSPLPFVYDLADLYKEKLYIVLAITIDMAGRYNEHKIVEGFRKRVIEMDLLALWVLILMKYWEIKMVVVIANELPSAVRGRMNLWFVEPRPNIFVSGVKNSVDKTVVYYLYEQCTVRRTGV